MLELYLGGARSGKSRLAEQRAIDSRKKKIYLATATAGDGEMSARIRLHREQRQSQQWLTIEEPVSLAATLLTNDSIDHCILVDCLTLWLTNLLLSSDEQCFMRERQALFDCLPLLQSQVIFVSNEVGQGVVPTDALSRRFVDESGFLHQRLAEQVDRVVFTVAGLPQLLKGE